MIGVRALSILTGAALQSCWRSYCLRCHFVANQVVVATVWVGCGLAHPCLMHDADRSSLKGRRENPHLLVSLTWPSGRSAQAPLCANSCFPAWIELSNMDPPSLIRACSRPRVHNRTSLHLIVPLSCLGTLWTTWDPSGSTC